MRVLIVCESMFGNTRLIADAIATGFEPEHEVLVVPVDQATDTLLREAQLVVVGGPTHVYGMSRPRTRRWAADWARVPRSRLVLETDPEGPGVRDWLAELGEVNTKAATFDTRYQGSALFSGRASKGISRQLRHHGFHLVAEPESFFVSDDSHLVPGEEARARGWGELLAASIASSEASSSRRA